MQISKNELISIIDDATTAFAELLLTHCRQQVELHEDTFSQTQNASSDARLNFLKKELEKAKERYDATRDHERRNRALRRLKQMQDKDREDKTALFEKNSGSTVRYTDGQGRFVGLMRRTGKNRADFFDASGKLVAREIDGSTFDGSGNFSGRGNIGLLLLGKSLRK